MFHYNRRGRGIIVSLTNTCLFLTWIISESKANPRVVWELIIDHGHVSTSDVTRASSSEPFFNTNPWTQLTPEFYERYAKPRVCLAYPCSPFGFSHWCLRCLLAKASSSKRISQLPLDKPLSLTPGWKTKVDARTGRIKKGYNLLLKWGKRQFNQLQVYTSPSIV